MVYSTETVEIILIMVDRAMSYSTASLRKMEVCCVESTRISMLFYSLPLQIFYGQLQIQTSGDTCRISNSCQASDMSCDRYKGVEKGDGSSTKIGSGPDQISCFTTNFAATCEMKNTIVCYFSCVGG